MSEFKKIKRNCSYYLQAKLGTQEQENTQKVLSFENEITKLKHDHAALESKVGKLYISEKVYWVI